MTPRLAGDNPRELPPGPCGPPLDQPGHRQLPAGAGARPELPPHHRTPDLDPGPQETGAQAPTRLRGQIVQIIRVSSPGEMIPMSLEVDLPLLISPGASETD